MKKMYEVRLLSGTTLALFTSRYKAYKFHAEYAPPYTSICSTEVNIFTYYFYKLIGR